ncbi:MAG: hypothetical protein ACK52N_03230 [Lysobacteraceae bacterium]
MSTSVIRKVAYAVAARRHFADADLLLSNGRQANAGQLLGLAAECGLKAIVVACGAATTQEGDVVNPQGLSGKGFKDHFPQLEQVATQHGGLLPDTRFSTRYLARMQNLSAFSDWTVSQRYWCHSVVPIASIPNWKLAADEVMAVLDQAQQDGVL